MEGAVMDKKVGSRRNPGIPIQSTHLEPQWVGIDVTCQRHGHKPQVWKVRRDIDGPKAGGIWFEKQPDGTIPEQANPDPEHPRLEFLCPSCGHDAIWTIETANRHLDRVVDAGMKVAVYPL